MTSELPPRQGAEMVRAARGMLPTAPRTALCHVALLAASQSATTPTWCAQMSLGAKARPQASDSVTNRALRNLTSSNLSHHDAFRTLGSTALKGRHPTGHVSLSCTGGRARG